MSSLQVIPKDHSDQILRDLVGKQLQAVLSCHQPDGWRTCRLHFVSGSAPSKTITVQTRRGDDQGRGPLPSTGQTVGVTFRLGHKKCMFAAIVQAITEHNEGRLLTLRWPENIHQLQRRAYERAVPPAGRVIPVRFWREEAASTTQADSRRVKHGQLEDLSAGGMRIQTGDSSELEIGRSYRCVFAPQPGAPPLVLEAALRHHQTTDQNRASLGLHFVGLETTPEGRHLLDRLVKIVNHFQRAQARSSR